ncbi:KdsC family phosphatase [Denitratisoma oestradiolicum]|uniref:3-deoxy-D-manno-octulosonate 8-phosphate phosphatase KdsC n=1 Tax=Denitratisoma oestradiolicum TaxID=311182 RepID=A0A6S6XZP1_9PROT|nr:HAD family hydrolase [Denitratisoma oestradiolicum]TWO79087.1 phenylphosphate carboxylase subunit delta [Denitratisoma oestradiolicum]CAB1369921.1 3-deoxy-D-manno-octulosonate 8-phosphate phosphatase [Denitratisoma oestradiolicum]
MDAKAKASRIRLMGFDVDGVLTDGSLYFTSQGDEMKAFSSLDGHGLKMLASSGIKLAIITGRNSRAVELRARNLGIDLLLQGVEDKRGAMAELLAGQQLDFSQAGYMGDDVVDLPLLRACGFSASVADGHPFVQRHVDFVSSKPGGHGAVREVCEFILEAQGRLSDLLEGYLR